MKRDYYEILQVTRSSSGGEIKKSYRKIAFECHPDRNPGDTAAEDRFKEAAEAYEVLSDSQKRQLYDAHGHAGLGGAGVHHYTDAEEIFSHFGDLFEDFFGFTGGRGPGGRSRRQRGVDLSYNLVIPFEEAVFGCEHEIEFLKRVSCDDCGGSGAAPESQEQTCPQCDGHGQVRVNQGFFSVQSTCPQCRGQGKFITDPCPECSGAGLAEQKKTLKVKVPPGVDTETRLVLRGEGEVGSGAGATGDLYVNIHVKPHALYWREGQDLHAELEVSMVQAALGSRVEIESLDGPQEVDVGRGIQTGEVIKLKRLGVPHVRSGKRGDLMLHVFVKTPQKLSRSESKILEQFAEEAKESTPRLRKRR